MRKTTKAGTLALATAVLATPLAASADVGHVDDPRNPKKPAYADLVALRLFHKKSDVAATLRIPVSAKRKLAVAKVHIQPKGAHTTWTVAVRRNPQGEVTSKRIIMQEHGEPIAVSFPCKGIRAIHGIEKVYISTPRHCFGWGKPSIEVPVDDYYAAPRRSRPIRARATIVARVGDHKVRDSTKWTEYLKRG